MAISLTPSQLKSICPHAPVSAVLPLNVVLAAQRWLGRTSSWRPELLAMVPVQVGAPGLDRSRSAEQRPSGVGARPARSASLASASLRRCPEDAEETTRPQHTTQHRRAISRTVGSR